MGYTETQSVLGKTAGTELENFIGSLNEHGKRMSELLNRLRNLNGRLMEEGPIGEAGNKGAPNPRSPGILLSLTECLEGLNMISGGFEEHIKRLERII